MQPPQEGVFVWLSKGNTFVKLLLAHATIALSRDTNDQGGSSYPLMLMPQKPCFFMFAGPWSITSDP